MPEFVNDDAGYFTWLDNHPDGFVLNRRNGSNRKSTVLHKVCCDTISRENQEQGTFTGNNHWKICEETVEDLQLDDIRQNRDDGMFYWPCGLCHPE